MPGPNHLRQPGSGLAVKPAPETAPATFGDMDEQDMLQAAEIAKDSLAFLERHPDGRVISYWPGLRPAEDR